MINANELRIGNKVMLSDTPYWSDKYRGKPFTVKSAAHIDSANHYDPIPLTPELLVECGFKETRHYLMPCYSLEIGDMRFAYYPKTGEFYCTHGLVPHIKHLHQLQNLYFSLTNTELI